MSKSGISSPRTPYLLLLPGIAFLFTFFILPIANLAQTSTQTPIAGGDTGQNEQTLRFSNYVDAFTENQEQFARSFIFALCATVLALAIASKRVGLPSISGPPLRDATSIALMSLAKFFARRLSMTAFLCLVVAHLEWPDIFQTPQSLLGMDLLYLPLQISSKK